MKISEKTRALCERAEFELKDIFAQIDDIARKNTEHVLDCFHECEISESHFAPSTGYGCGDRGRDTIDRLASMIFRAEAGFMRPSLLSGTHTLTVALFGILRPGDVMLSISGMPYDTLRDVLGVGDGCEEGGSLRDFGIGFEKVELSSDRREPIDYPAMREAMKKIGGKLKMVYVQRSKGYADRPALSTAQIRRAAYMSAKFAAELGIARPVFMTDNCYGEFTELYEPCYAPAADELPADIIAGSLIKNPGGGMADVGGYIVGTPECVHLCGNRLTAPGVGLDIGASLGQNRNLIKGLFYAPHTTAQALKTAHLAAYIFAEIGLRVDPLWNETRHDIVQVVECADPAGLSAFCLGIQSASPIDGHVIPEAYEMPGYADPVIMAAGAFTGGSSIELSADGPMKPPYTAFMQGGLTYESSRLAVMSAADRMSDLRNHRA